MSSEMTAMLQFNCVNPTVAFSQKTNTALSSGSFVVWNNVSGIDSCEWGPVSTNTKVDLFYFQYMRKVPN